MDSGDIAKSGSAGMTSFASMHPLKYIAEALSQMASTLRDFKMEDSAELLEKAKSDINQKLSQQETKENVEN